MTTAGGELTQLAKDRMPNTAPMFGSVQELYFSSSSEAASRTFTENSRIITVDFSFLGAWRHDDIHVYGWPDDDHTAELNPVLPDIP